MQFHERISEVSTIQQQLDAASVEFDMALDKDVPLGELKRIFHEMKILKDQLDTLNENNKNANKQD